MKKNAFRSFFTVFLVLALLTCTGCTVTYKTGLPQNPSNTTSPPTDEVYPYTVIDEIDPTKDYMHRYSLENILGTIYLDSSSIPEEFPRDLAFRAQLDTPYEGLYGFWYDQTIRKGYSYSKPSVERVPNTMTVEAPTGETFVTELKEETDYGYWYEKSYKTRNSNDEEYTVRCTACYRFGTSGWEIYYLYIYSGFYGTKTGREMLKDKEQYSSAELIQFIENFEPLRSFWDESYQLQSIEAYSYYIYDYKFVKTVNGIPTDQHYTITINPYTGEILGYSLPTRPEFQVEKVPAALDSAILESTARQYCSDLAERTELDITYVFYTMPVLVQPEAGQYRYRILVIYQIDKKQSSEKPFYEISILEIDPSTFETEETN